MAITGTMILDETQLLYTDASGVPYYCGQAYRKTLTYPIPSRYNDEEQVVKLSAKRALPSTRGFTKEDMETD